MSGAASQKLLGAGALGISLLFGAAPALAHKASDGYLLLQQALEASTSGDGKAPASIRAELSLALKDLDAALPVLDADDDRVLTRGEVRRALPQIVGWVEAGFALRCGAAPLPVRFRFDALEQRSDGVYLRLATWFDCRAPAPLALDYRLFDGIDASHRLLVGGQLDGAPVALTTAPRRGTPLLLRSAVSAAAATEPAAAAAAPAPGQSGAATFGYFFPEGVQHILSGIDHLAFLLALLLPIRLFRARSGVAAAAARQQHASASAHGFGALLRTVTAFTIGHSLTLGLASIGWIHASPRWVEPAIAITIAISAMLNLYPLRRVRGDALALVFGLVHGLGFSQVMSEAGIGGTLLLWGLAGFNLGVEAGQLLVVLGWCALQWLLVRLSLYRPALVRGGSWALIALAAYWTLQRVSL